MLFIFWLPFSSPASLSRRKIKDLYYSLNFTGLAALSFVFRCMYVSVLRKEGCEVYIVGAMVFLIAVRQGLIYVC